MRRKMIMVALVLLLVAATIIVSVGNQYIHPATMQGSIKNYPAQTINAGRRQIIKPAFGNSDIVFGPLINITNATYLGSIHIQGNNTAFYELYSGRHYIAGLPPSEKPLNWNYIRNLAQVRINDFNINPGNNYVSKNYGDAVEVYNSSSEIEGAEIVGNYIYLTYRSTSNNIEMRELGTFKLVKSITIGDSSYYHVGGIVYDGNGHLWTILAKPVDEGPSYIYEFNLNLTEVQHFVTDNDHYGTVFYADNNITIVGNWNCDQIAEFNVTTHNLIWKVNTPAPFKSTQDVAYLGGSLYLGARYRNDFNYSGIYLYHWDGSNITFDTNLIAYNLTGGNPVAVDSQGYIYAYTTDLHIFKSQDVFLPLLSTTITGGDKYNLGFSDIWPAQDSGHEQYTIGGTGSDFAIGYEGAGVDITRTTIFPGITTGTFNWSYYGTYADVNGIEVKGGLPTSADLESIAAQTWNSATENLLGSLYLAKAVPYIVGYPPQPPTNIQATGGNKYVLLSWVPPSNDGGHTITEYKIYRGTSSGGENLIASVSADKRVYNDTSVVNGQKYYYYVTAVNDVMESEPSMEVNATPATVPSSPRNLQAVAGKEEIYLTWDSPADNGGAPITGYRLYRGTESGSETYLTTVDSTKTNYTDSGLITGETYYYYVTALNDKGESEKSNEVGATPLSVPTPPQNLRIKADLNYTSLVWDPPASDGGCTIKEYRIYRGERIGDETYIATVSANILSFIDSSVRNGYTYYYYVTAVNSVGESLPSNEVHAMIPTVPSQPLNLHAVAGEGYVNLSWSPPANDGGSKIKEYKIYRGTESGKEVCIATIPANLTYYNDTSVRNGKTYYYYVVAVNDVGAGPPSKEIKATPSSGRSSNLGGNTALMWIILAVVLASAILLLLAWSRHRRRDLHK